MNLTTRVQILQVGNADFRNRRIVLANTPKRKSNSREKQQSEKLPDLELRHFLLRYHQGPDEGIQLAK